MPDDPERKRSSDPRTGEPPPRSAAILVVDDMEVNRELLSERLSERGHLVFQAADGESALELIEQQTFDAVILDVMMPRIDGLTLLRIIREKHSLAELPVLMATARGERADLIEALRLGANDYLVKPLDYAIVHARLETQLRLKRSNEEVLRLNRQLRQANDRISRLVESSAEAFRDIGAWSRTIAEDLAVLVGAPSINVWLLEGDEIAPVAGDTADSPSPADMILASERPMLSRASDCIVAIHGMTGELLGALVIRERRTLDEPELQLMRGFARQLGDALQLQRLRADLSVAQARLQARRQEMLDRGVAILSACPKCGACYGESIRYCLHDGDTIEEARPLLPHRILGRYRLDRILGQGGMGRLFEAHDEKLERAVAVKILRPDRFADEAVRMRFEQEARAIARIDHPGVVAIHDSGEIEDGSLFLVMELLRGSDLGLMIRLNGRGRPREVAAMLREAGSALCAAHAAGFIHRDIKPENIFLVQDGDANRVKVLDFGIARPLNADMRLTQTGNFVGTPAYMAPEQMTGGVGDTRSDLYSLAAVAFEALSGCRVTPGDELAQIFNDVLHTPRPRLSSVLTGVSPQVDEAFSAALSRDPADRPRSIESWLDSFLGELERMPSDAPGWRVLTGDELENLSGAPTRPSGPRID
ncbi:MAG: response regulator [Thermoanaerobaculia bacterium]|nr:response regulator [Thermoanaerobaculia bacterium]